MKAFIASVAAALVMTGCATAAETPESTAPVSQSPDDFFLTTIEEELPQFPIQNDDALIEAGKSICTYFEDNGVSLLNLGVLSNEFYAQGFSNEETAKIFVISTTAYCPEIKDALLSLDTGTGF